MREPQYLFKLDSSTTAEDGGPYAADVVTTFVDTVGFRVQEQSARWLVGDQYTEHDAVEELNDEPGYAIEAGRKQHHVATYDVAEIIDLTEHTL